jgi:hypothetical protein
MSVEGAYSMSKAGLEMSLAASSAANEVLATTTTAADGRYKLQFTPAGVGTLSFVRRSSM